MDKFQKYKDWVWIINMFVFFTLINRVGFDKIDGTEDFLLHFVVFFTIFPAPSLIYRIFFKKPTASKDNS